MARSSFDLNIISPNIDIPNYWNLYHICCFHVLERLNCLAVAVWPVRVLGRFPYQVTLSLRRVAVFRIPPNPLLAMTTC